MLWNCQVPEHGLIYLKSCDGDLKTVLNGEIKATVYLHLFYSLPVLKCRDIKEKKIEIRELIVPGNC